MSKASIEIYERLLKQRHIEMVAAAENLLRALVG